MRTVRVRAPAKLNLGLAITGRRPDGFHDLVTVMQAIALADDLTLARVSAEGEARCEVGSVRTVLPEEDGDPVIGSADNLAARAVVAAVVAAGEGGHWRLSLDKAIPAASGMGGASADAAAALVAVEAILGRSVPDRDGVALSLGSDVPFFLHGGTALVGGRGEAIEPLPSLSGGSFVLVFPRGLPPIPRKTAALYGALQPGDFADGEDVRRFAASLGRGAPLPEVPPANGFVRALDRLQPALVELQAEIRRVAGREPHLSGAGPTHYLPVADVESAAGLADDLARALGGRALVRVAAPWQGPPRVEGDVSP